MIIEIRGREKYVLDYPSMDALRAYLVSAQNEAAFIPEGCRPLYTELMNLLREPWDRILAILARQSEGDETIWNPNADVFIIPAAWDDGTFDTPWNSSDLEPIARAHENSVALPVQYARAMDQALEMFKRLRTGACARNPSRLVIGAGILGLAGVSWFLWNKWRG